METRSRSFVWRGHEAKPQLPSDCVVLDIRSEDYTSDAESCCSRSSAREHQDIGKNDPCADLFEIRSRACLSPQGKTTSGFKQDAQPCTTYPSSLSPISDTSTACPSPRQLSFPGSPAREAGGRNWTQGQSELAKGQACEAPPVSGDKEPSKEASEEPPASIDMEHLPGSEKEFEFEVNVEKGSQQLGVDVLHQDTETLLITRINSGLILQWNQAHPDNCVRAGDRVIEVNGQRGGSEFLVGAIRNGISLRLKIRQLLEFSMSVEKKGRLGLDIMQHAKSLRVLYLSPGPFQDWNRKAGLDRQVRSGDHVVEVNGSRGMAPELIAAIKESDGDTWVTFRRSIHSQQPPPPPYAAASKALRAAKLLPAPAVQEEQYCLPKDGYCTINIGE